MNVLQFSDFRSAIYDLTLLSFLTLTLAGCEKDSLIPSQAETSQRIALRALNDNGNGIIHQVTAGGFDFCDPTLARQDCDANFSLTAIQYADGSVKGQYVDVLRSADFTGIHVDVDCLIVEGNRAIIGGVVTKGAESGSFSVGTRVITMVVDNGTSTNDSADQISFSYLAGTLDCSDVNFEQFQLLEVRKGQVKVR